jgi:hypothetical protein
MKTHQGLSSTIGSKQTEKMNENSNGPRIRHNLFQPGNKMAVGRKPASHRSRDRAALLRARFVRFLSRKFDDFVEAYENLSPRDQVKLYGSICEFVLPRMRPESSSKLEKLDDQSLNRIVDQLRSQIKEEPVTELTTHEIINDAK